MYIQTNNKQRGKQTKIIAIVAIFAVLLVILVQTAMPHFLPALFTSIVRPYWRMKFSIESGSLSSPTQLLDENESLKRKLSEMSVLFDSSSAVMTENEQLKSLFVQDFSPTFPTSTTSSTSTKQVLLSDTQKLHDINRVLVPVLMNPPQSPYDQLIIDGGVDLGFVIGDRVYASERILIGKISDVLGETAKVILFTSPGEKHQVFIGTGNTPATAIGLGGGQYVAEIPQAVSVSKGDFVIAPSLADLPFGIVDSIISDPTKPFKAVLFAPPVNIYEIRWVLVERGKTK